jgi:hypothetical protein
MMIRIGLLCAGLLVLSSACEKKSDASTDKTDLAKAKETATPAAPAKTAEPAKPAGIAASEKAPFESLVFKPNDKKDANGWPLFDAFNAGMKVVTFANLTGFAYDKDGKFVASTKPLSWNPGKLASGAKSDWDLKIGDREAGKVSDKATQFEICYDSIWFDGEEKAVTGKGCDEKRPLGGTKSAAGVDAKKTPAK